jgi:hypothetical protein
MSGCFCLVLSTSSLSDLTRPGFHARIVTTIRPFVDTAACRTSAWFRISRLWVTEVRGNCRPARAGFRFERLPVREAANLPASNSPGLQWPKAQQRKPMRMALAGHQFPRAIAVAVGKLAAHEASMVQEELKQTHAHQRIPAMRCIRWANQGSGQDRVLPQVIDVLSAYRNGRVCRQFIFHDGSEREEGVA